MDYGPAMPTTTGANAFGCGAESVSRATRPSLIFYTMSAEVVHSRLVAILKAA